MRRHLSGFKTKLDPNKAQARYFARACGVARFSYNWALEQWQKQYQAHKKDPSVPLPNEAALRRQINSIKKTEFPWMLEVTKCAVQYGIKNLGQAFQNFFKNPKHFGYPRFKKKYVDDSFTLSNDDFKIEGSRIRIPRIGWVRMHEALRFENAKPIFATVSRVAGDWYISLQVELPNLEHLRPAVNRGKVGADLGVKKMVKLSDGQAFEAPKPLRKYLQKLKRLQRKMSRAKKGRQQSSQARQGHCTTASENRQHPRGCTAQGDKLHCGELFDGCARGSQCQRHAQEPQACPMHCRCRLWRISAAACLQDGAARRRADRSEPLVPELEAVPLLSQQE